MQAILNLRHKWGNIALHRAWGWCSLMKQRLTPSSQNNLLSGYEELGRGLRKKLKDKMLRKGWKSDDYEISGDWENIENGSKKLDMSVESTATIRLTNLRKACPIDNFDNHWYILSALNSICTIPHIHKYMASSFRKGREKGWQISPYSTLQLSVSYLKDFLQNSLHSPACSYIWLGLTIEL